MRNIAYFGWSGSPEEDANQLFEDCIKSLKNVTDVDIYVTTFPGILSPEIEKLVTPIYVSHEQWNNRRLTAKLEKMLEDYDPWLNTLSPTPYYVPHVRKQKVVETKTLPDFIKESDSA